MIKNEKSIAVDIEHLGLFLTSSCTIPSAMCCATALLSDGFTFVLWKPAAGVSCDISALPLSLSWLFDILHTFGRHRGRNTTFYDLGGR
jgi:hypothetical protein